MNSQNSSFLFNNSKKLFDRFFKNQHPEAALRYSPVVDAINKLKLPKPKILEIGSGSLGITPYLNKEVDGLDIDFKGPQTDLLKKIKGSATKIPFRKNSYDIVVAVDVLEHIKKEDREKVIEQMLKVSKKLVVIVVPVGELSHQQDTELYLYWKKIFGDENQFLKEHVTNGLPATEEILVILDRAMRKLEKNGKIRSVPNLNLTVRKFLMKTWISKNMFVYYLYLKGYLLLLPFLKRANFSNCYRRVFVIEFS